MITKTQVKYYLDENDGKSVLGKKAARADGLSFPDNVWSQIVQQIRNTPESIGELTSPDKRRAKAQGTSNKVFVFTSAQNNTNVHEGFWHSLQAYCKTRDAELHVSRFMYNKGSMAASGAKAGSSGKADSDDMWYDYHIEPYVSDESLQITDDLVWCGELNIIPTRVHPLSTLRTYTRGNSGIVPHVKMRMDSVPTMKHQRPVFMYTTGTVTKRNYIQRSAGQVAEFHHVFGALVVEVCKHTGEWWARQINAETQSGHFYDLDTYWTPDGPQDGQRVLAITHGDIHGFKVDKDIFETVFKEGGVVDQLMPFEQYMHDTLDFMPRNHHNIKDPHFLWEMQHNGTDSVQDEFRYAVDLLMTAYRSYCKTYVVASNHDVAINHWLKNTTAFYDPVNVEFWLQVNLRIAQCLREGKRICPFEEALFVQAFDKSFKDGADFPYAGVIAEDQSRKIIGTDIEAGLHGHLGPNGARGSPSNLRVVGKANTAHTHSAGIIDGIYTAGVYGMLDMGYNKGLSSWSHSMIVTYRNGKRAILTIKRNKAWRDML